MRTRIGRDPKTGQRLVYNIDTGVVVDNHQCGSGFFNNMASAIASKVTSQAAKDLATKAADKSITTAATKVGEKAGQVISEKIDDKFGKKKKPTIPSMTTLMSQIPKPKQTQKTKPKETKENKGEEIVKLLQQIDQTKVKDTNPISVEFDKLIM